MILNQKKKESTSVPSQLDSNQSDNFVNLNHSKKKTISSKGKMGNEADSNSGTSISSNKDTYNNLISKLKLKKKQNQNHAYVHSQTLILHTSLDKSLNSIINDSVQENESDIQYEEINLNDLNSSIKEEINENENITEDVQDMLNNGFILNQSPIKNNKNNLSNNKNDNNKLFNDPQNNKRNKINNINKMLEEENYFDISSKGEKKTEKEKKRNFTLNEDHNMNFLNDANKKSANNNKIFPSNNLLNNLKHGGKESLKDKVYLPQNEFEDNVPGINRGENHENTNIFSNCNQNNPFCNINQKNNKNSNNNKNKDISSNKKILEPKKLNNNNNKNKNSPLENLSTNINTNQDNTRPEVDKNNNTNNNGISCFNLGNNNFSINSLNFGQSINELNNNNNNNKNEKGNNNKDTIHQNKDDFNKNFSFNPNIDYNKNQNKEKIKNNRVPDGLEKLSQKNNINKGNTNNTDSDDFKDIEIEILKEQLNPNIEHINDKENNVYLINHGLDISKDYSPLDINEEKDLISKDYPKDKAKNNLSSLLYGLLLGSTVTGLFWLRNEETKKYFWEKIKGINYESIISLFKSMLHPFVFFKKKFNDEKKKAYLKVLSITFGKFYDFFENYGDGFRILGLFISVYAIWLIFKSLIRMSIKLWKNHN